MATKKPSTRRVKKEPSSTYLDELVNELRETKDRFEFWKNELYKVTATAKLGDNAFETARQNCLSLTVDLKWLDAEVDRVTKALRA